MRNEIGLKVQVEMEIPCPSSLDVQMQTVLSGWKREASSKHNFSDRCLKQLWSSLGLYKEHSIRIDIEELRSIVRIIKVA